MDRGDHRLDRVERRMDKQHRRIKQGVRSGELTRYETRKLRKQQRRIAKMKYRFMYDGYLNRHESRKLQYKLDAASDRIYRFKHNHKTRGYRRHHG